MAWTAKDVILSFFQPWRLSIANVKLFSQAEAAPTPVLSAAEGPPGYRAWEPGLLDKTTYGQSPAQPYCQIGEKLPGVGARLA